MLDCKQIYIDTRFKTPDSKSDSDFFVELPSTVNIPDNCVCYIDDIVIPMSWNTVDYRNNKMYVRISYRDTGLHMDQNITIPSKNYNGIQFAAALELAMNDAAFYMPPPQFKVSFDMNTNMLTITQLDRFDVISFSIISDEDVVSGRYWDARVSKIIRTQ
jgi:hypothetical protein